MRVVIDIDDNIYHRFVSGFANDDDAYLIEQLFKNSTPLPKGHGRLIDAKQAEERLRQVFDEHADYNSLARYIVRNPNETPTIIKADNSEVD